MAVNFFEELVKVYYQTLGYFTIENIPYTLPKTTKIDETYRHGPSEIDIIAVHMTKSKLMPLAVTCKGHLDGLKIDHAIKAIQNGGKIHERDARKAFRELAFDDWGGSFKAAICQRTGKGEFQHVTACTKFVGDQKEWCENPQFSKHLKGNSLSILTLDTILSHLSANETKLRHQNQTVRHVIGLMQIKAKS